MAFIKANERVDEEVSTGFDPIRKGKYNVYLYDVEAGEFGPQSKNPGRPNYQLKLKIAEGQPFAGRFVWQTVGLFPNWSSGSANWLFFQLYAALNNISEAEARKKFNADGGLEYPEPEDIIGKVVEATITAQSNTYQGETTIRNGVGAFAIAGKGAAAQNNVSPKINADLVAEIDL